MDEGGGGLRCRACGSERLSLLMRSPIAESRECGSCHSVENHVLVDRDRFYDESYFRRNYDPVSGEQYQRFASLLKDTAPLIATKTLLDVGCGSGVLLRAWADLGYEGTGVDASADAIRLARERLAGTGITVQHVSEPLNEKYGVVAFMDSLASIGRCDEVFAGFCTRNLDDGGIVILRTPGYMRLYFRYAKVLSVLLASERYRSSISAEVLHAPSRLMLFTKQGLVALLERNGLSVKGISESRDFEGPPGTPHGLKARVATLLLERIPMGIRRHTSLLVVARKGGG